MKTEEIRERLKDRMLGERYLCVWELREREREREREKKKEIFLKYDLSLEGLSWKQNAFKVRMVVSFVAK